MHELINVGDEIKNWSESCVTISSIASGRLGLLLKGRYSEGGYPYEEYIPWELPPIQPPIRIHDGCWLRASITLDDGTKLGSVALRSNDPRDTIEEYEAEWERTIELIRNGELEAG